jgi:hypothetical protein
LCLPSAVTKLQGFALTNPSSEGFFLTWWLSWSDHYHFQHRILETSQMLVDSARIDSMFLSRVFWPLSLTPAVK